MPPLQHMKTVIPQFLSWDYAALKSGFLMATLGFSAHLFLIMNFLMWWFLSSFSAWVFISFSSLNCSIFKQWLCCQCAWPWKGSRFERGEKEEGAQSIKYLGIQKTWFLKGRDVVESGKTWPACQGKGFMTYWWREKHLLKRPEDSGKKNSFDIPCRCRRRTESPPWAPAQI